MKNRHARAAFACLLPFAGWGCAADAGAMKTAEDKPADAGSPHDSAVDRAPRDAADGATAPDVGPAMSCAETPTASAATGGVVELAVELSLDGKPLIFGQSNRVAGGTAITPINVRFYVSDVALVRASGDPVPVDLINAGGALAPYGVHLFNAEDDASHTLRLRAPPGDYTGLALTFGLKDACNDDRQAGQRRPPLSPTSQMTWPGAGYLFFRYEGQSDPPSAERPSTIHMGGFPSTLFAPVIRVDGALTVPASGKATRKLVLVMDEVWKGATAKIDGGQLVLPGDEVLAGERLRQSAPKLHLLLLPP